MAPSETPMARWAWVVIGANESHRSWVHAASRPYPARIAHRFIRTEATLRVTTVASLPELQWMAAHLRACRLGAPGAYG